MKDEDVNQRGREGLASRDGPFAFATQQVTSEDRRLRCSCLGAVCISVAVALGRMFCGGEVKVCSGSLLWDPGIIE